MQEFIKTKISDDGLRYVSRQGGSPFGTLGDCRSTLSCYKCGTHKPRSLGTNKKSWENLCFVALTVLRSKIKCFELLQSTQWLHTQIRKVELHSGFIPQNLKHF